MRVAYDGAMRSLFLPISLDSAEACFLRSVRSEVDPDAAVSTHPTPPSFLWSLLPVPPAWPPWSLLSHPHPSPSSLLMAPSPPPRHSSPDPDPHLMVLPSTGQVHCDECLVHQRVRPSLQATCSSAQATEQVLPRDGRWGGERYIYIYIWKEGEYVSA